MWGAENSAYCVNLNKWLSVFGKHLFCIRESYQRWNDAIYRIAFCFSIVAKIEFYTEVCENKLVYTTQFE